MVKVAVKSRKSSPKTPSKVELKAADNPLGETNESKTADGIQERILRAARLEFIRQGLGGARMRAIAKEAKVNPALLHYYFRNKENLYQEALLETVKTVWSHLEIPSVDWTSAERSRELPLVLRGILKRYLKIILGHPEFPRFLLREIVDGGQYLPQVQMEALKRFRPFFEGISRHLGEEALAGRMRPIKPLDALLNLMGMALSSVLFALISEKLRSETQMQITFDEDFQDRRVDEIVRTFFDGLRTQP